MNPRRTRRTRYNPIENGQIFYFAECDNTTPIIAERTFDLNEYDKLTEWIEKCKENKWDYSVYIEVHKNDDKDGFYRELVTSSFSFQHILNPLS